MCKKTEGQVPWNSHRASDSVGDLDENNTCATNTHADGPDEVQVLEDWIENFYLTGMGDSPRMDEKKG